MTNATDGCTSPPLAPLRVLLADDTPEIRTLLRRVLEVDHDVEIVGEASDGAGAVDLAERTRPDAILLDLAMPVMDGLQAIPEIRRRSPGTQIVVLSAFGASEMGRRAMQAGAAAYLTKGKGPDEILATLREVVRLGPPGARAGVAAAPGVPAPSIEASYRRRRNSLPLLTHEMGNQLTVIQGFAEMLLDGLGTLPVDTARQFAEAIVRNARQMRALLEATSDMQKLDAGTLEVNPVPVDLVPLVRQLANDFENVLGDRRLVLALPATAVVFADPLRVRQVLANLLGNAAKFTPTGTVVSVGIDTGTDDLELTVADDGPGIPPGREGELFEKFSRLGSTAKGTGIGLYLSRRIARAHGGDLTLVPQRRGCGFALRLPLDSGAVGLHEPVPDPQLRA